MNSEEEAAPEGANADIPVYPEVAEINQLADSPPSASYSLCCCYCR